MEVKCTTQQTVKLEATMDIAQAKALKELFATVAIWQPKDPWQGLGIDAMTRIVAALPD